MSKTDKMTYFYKVLRALFYLAGFPLFIVALYFSTTAMRQSELMGDFARNWILIFLGIWAGVEIIRFALNKTIGAKSEQNKKIVTIVMAVVLFLSVLLPAVIFDGVVGGGYADAKEELSTEAQGHLREYKALKGWHRGFTTDANEVKRFTDEHEAFLEMYGITQIESSWYGNADKENNVGYIMGSREKIELLLDEKKAAVAKLAAATAELANVEAAYAKNQADLVDAEAAYEADPSSANKEAVDKLNAAIAENEKDLVRLKGFRIDISAYKEPLIDIVMELLTDLSGDFSSVFPDGIDLSLFGINIGEFEELIELVLPMVVGSVVDKDMLMDLIPDVIYTGIGDETVATYEGLVNGTDTDMSLAQIEALAFKMEYYPSALSGAATVYLCYIFIGVIFLSFILSSFFAQKIKELKGGRKDD